MFNIINKKERKIEMKYIAERGYKDILLKRHVDKDENLEEIYQKAGIELTEERRKLLVEERKIYIPVEETSEENEKDKVDIIPESKENTNEIEAETKEEAVDTTEITTNTEENTNEAEIETKEEEKNTKTISKTAAKNEKNN